MPKNLPSQFVCPSQKCWDFNEKSVLLASVVRACKEEYKDTNNQKVWATDFEDSKTELGINHGNIYLREVKWTHHD